MHGAICCLLLQVLAYSPYCSLYAVLAARDAGIVHAVAALVAVEWCLARFPPWVPYGIAILDVEIATAVIHRHSVVTVTGDATELGILVERITTCCV